MAVGPAAQPIRSFKYVVELPHLPSAAPYPIMHVHMSLQMHCRAAILPAPPLEPGV